MNFSRYAIYYTVPHGPLSEFGAKWLGWDATNGQSTTAPDVPNLPAPAHDLTQTPRKYGLHGTIKPPFRLAQGHSADALSSAMQEFCDSQSPVWLDGLELTRLGRFLALTVAGDQSTLADLAGDAVRALDRFRAPPTQAELERRRAAKLSDRQEALLEQWGYPYVIDQFKFHLTLTSKLPKAQTLQVQKTLQPVLEPLLPRPFIVDALTLCGEDENGMFHEIHRYALSA